MATFEFFNKRGRDQENDERNEKLHGGERWKLRCFNIGLIECLDCTVSFIQSSTTLHCNGQLASAQWQECGVPLLLISQLCLDGRLDF